MELDKDFMAKWGNLYQASVIPTEEVEAEMEKLKAELVKVPDIRLPTGFKFSIDINDSVANDIKAMKSRPSHVNDSYIITGSFSIDQQKDCSSEPEKSDLDHLVAFLRSCGIQQIDHGENQVDGPWILIKNNQLFMKHIEIDLITGDYTMVIKDKPESMSSIGLVKYIEEWVNN